MDPGWPTEGLGVPGRGASVMFLDCWQSLLFQMTHTAQTPPSCFICFLSSFFLLCFHALESLLVYFSLCIHSRHLLFLSPQHPLPNIVKSLWICLGGSQSALHALRQVNQMLAPWNLISEQSNVKTTLLPAPWSALNPVLFET